MGGKKRKNRRGEKDAGRLDCLSVRTQTLSFTKRVKMKEIGSVHMTFYVVVDTFQFNTICRPFLLVVTPSGLFESKGVVLRFRFVIRIRGSACVTTTSVLTG